MSKHLADLRIYFELPDGTHRRTVNVWAERTGNTRHPGFELYIERFHQVMGGRDSWHASGLTIRRTSIVQRQHRDDEIPLSMTHGVRHFTGFLYGHADPDAFPPFQIPSNGLRSNDRRLSTIQPLPEHPHGYELFTVAPEQLSRARGILESTLPYPDTQIDTCLVVDWLDPAIALVAWRATSGTAYTVTQEEHSPTNSVRLAVSPGVYSGTPLRGAGAEDVLYHGPWRGPWQSRQSLDPRTYFSGR